MKERICFVYEEVVAPSTLTAPQSILGLAAISGIVVRYNAPTASVCIQQLSTWLDEPARSGGERLTPTFGNSAPKEALNGTQLLTR
jgi:hypothetical protein